jgi:hypothetical protein
MNCIYPQLHFTTGLTVDVYLNFLNEFYSLIHVNLLLMKCKCQKEYLKLESLWKVAIEFLLDGGKVLQGILNVLKRLRDVVGNQSNLVN